MILAHQFDVLVAAALRNVAVAERGPLYDAIRALAEKAGLAEEAERAMRVADALRGAHAADLEFEQFVAERLEAAR